MKRLLPFTFLALTVLAADADEVTSFSGGDGTTFYVATPSVVIASGQKAADNNSWTVSIYNTSGTSFGTTADFIGAGVQANRPITLIVALSQPGYYYISGTPQDGDAFSGTVIPTTDLAEQSSVDALNTAITNLETQTDQNTSDIAALQTLDSTLQDQVTSLQSAISVLQSNVTALQTNLSTTQNNVTDLQTNLTTTQDSVTALQSNLQSQIDDLSSQLETLTTILATTSNTLESKIATLQTTVDNPPSTAWTTSDYLILGGVAAGVTGIGVGSYSLFDSQSAPPPTDATNESP